MSRFAVILPAAGKSSRFAVQQSKKKVFVELKGRPVWVRTAEAFVNRDDVVQTIIVLSPDDIDWFKEKFRPNLAFMNIEIVAGGAERADSVRNALARVRADVAFDPRLGCPGRQAGGPQRGGCSWPGRGNGLGAWPSQLSAAVPNGDRNR